MRTFLRELEAQNQLIKIKKQVSTEFEISAVMKKLDGGSAVFFENVEGYSIPIVGGICGTRDRIAFSLKTKSSELLHKLLDAVEHRNPVRIVEKAPAQEIIEKEIDLLKQLPILTYCEKDGGPYITAGIVVAKDPLTGIRNVSIHRLMVIGRNKLAIRIVEGRHLDQYYKIAEGLNKPLEVGIAIGLHPVLLMASSSSVPLYVDEFEVASALAGESIELVKCKTVDVEVPAQAEIIIEGKILPHIRAKEGPFVDILGAYDIVREQPVVEVTCLTHRNNPIYQSILPGGYEHMLLMGLPQEPRIFKVVQNTVPSIQNVYLTPGGCHWLHGVISIKKRTEGDAKNAIIAALAAHPSLKHVIIVDDDIDIFNSQQVEYAIATRVQADRDVVIVTNVRGSSLDPSANQEQGALTSKVGIDATKSLMKQRELFELAKIPNENQIDLKKYLE
ncbi:MAG: UbiD family decarboxylase [Euryarchaeota archaeon]|nr:UbiD family decarboxylase [Euryarchaeota archaeon]